MFSDLFTQLHFAYIFSAAFLFLAGIYTAPWLAEKNIGWLLAYPRWIAGLMQKYFSARWGFLLVFAIILLLNNLSLFMGFVSGYFVILPVILAFLTGMNVAVIGYDMMGWQGIWHLLVNPVAWLEFPAAWLSFGLGIRLAHSMILYRNFAMVSKIFGNLLPLYFKYVFTLLFIAALLESALIVWAEKHKDEL